MALMRQLYYAERTKSLPRDASSVAQLLMVLNRKWLESFL